MRHSSKPVVIIGGGISGITSALRLKQQGIPFILIEKESDLGGLTRTDTVTTESGSFQFDQTGHFLHFQNKSIKNYCKPYLNIAGFEETKKKAGVISDLTNGICPAPLQYHSYLFNEETKEKIKTELHSETKTPPFDSKKSQSEVNFETFARRRFGETLSELLLSYNKKLYGPHVGKYAANQMGSYLPDSRLSTPKLREKLLQSLESKSSDNSYNATFHFSTRGTGIEGFIKVLAEELKQNLPSNSKIITSCAVTKINLEHQQIHLSTGNLITYLQIISSIAAFFF